MANTHFTGRGAAVQLTFQRHWRRASEFCRYPHMEVRGTSVVLWLFVMAAGVGLALAGENEAALKQQMRERIRAMVETNRAEMLTHGMTNENGEPMVPSADDATIDALYRMLVVHPAFGLGWDEVPAPSVKGVNNNKAVSDFVATNGWNMRTNEYLILALPRSGEPELCGLPWKEIQDRHFPAFTWGGILFVPWRGFGLGCNGVAYNPATNRFPRTINKFKPIGDHWYVWAQTDGPPGEQQYEGPSR